MRFSRSSALLEKTISTRLIGVPTPVLQRSRYGLAGNRLGKLRQRAGEWMAVASGQTLHQQSPPWENSCRLAFAKASWSNYRI
jgi:hypothetical protein